MRGILEGKTVCWRVCVLVIACRLHSCVGLPAEQPTKFSLNTDEVNRRDVVARMASTIEQGRALESQSNVAPLSAAQPETPQEQTPLVREMAVLLNETDQAILEKPISKPITGLLESFLHRAPLVDTLKEEERYGNTGRYTEIGRALVNGYEGFSNFLNSVIEIPRNAVQEKSRGITDMLRKVGQRLVGLE
ncbi:unnamed protein product [Xylocopa violacea]|uniref:Uncharacterized protein n=1 Tax=Xylocopa violacea TaxID=135666 RepID=A0ABP1N7F5_XYLVO